MQIEDGQHASSADVKTRLADLTQRGLALNTAAADYSTKLKAAIVRETEMEQLRKEFDHMGKSGPMKVSGRMVINVRKSSAL